MTERLQHWFALSEKGAQDLVRAVCWCFICNIAHASGGCGDVCHHASSGCA